MIRTASALFLATTIRMSASYNLPASVSCAFDSGNILVKSIDEDKDGAVFRLAVRKDPFTKGTDNRAHSQWFHFRASNVENKKCSFVIEDIDECSFAQGFDNYKVRASYDREMWFQVDNTSFETGKRCIPLQRFNSDALPSAPEGATKIESRIQWEMTPTSNSIFFAYWTPYSYERHMDVVAEMAAIPTVRHSVIGNTLDGRPLDMLTFGNGPLNLWLAARQHPGESMAEWCAEGFMRALGDSNDPVSNALLKLATIRVIPNMNPDGSVRGYLRTNAGGANLNREWTGGVYENYDAPSQERSPEVYYTMKALEHFGCDGHIDVHGDEEIEANFLAGAEGVPKWSESLAGVQKTYLDALLRINPDFQVGLGYDIDAPGTANLSICSNGIAQKFGCLALTLEQPFKDTTTPNGGTPETGWSAPRSLLLGKSLVAAYLESVSVIEQHKKTL